MLQNLLHSNKWPESEPTWFLSNTHSHISVLFISLFCCSSCSLCRFSVYYYFTLVGDFTSTIPCCLADYATANTVACWNGCVCVCCAWLWCTCSHWWLFKIQKQFFGIWSTCIRFTSIFESKFQIYWLRYFCYLSNLEQLFRCFSNCCCLEN